MYPNMTIKDMENTTMADLEVLQEAYYKGMADKKFLSALTAWYTVQAGATDKKGKSIFKNFESLYSVQGEIQMIEEVLYGKEKPQKSRMSKTLEKIKDLNKEDKTNGII